MISPPPHSTTSGLVLTCEGWEDLGWAGYSTDGQTHDLHTEGWVGLVLTCEGWEDLGWAGYSTGGQTHDLHTEGWGVPWPELKKIVKLPSYDAVSLETSFSPMVKKYFLQKIQSKFQINTSKVKI